MRDRDGRFLVLEDNVRTPSGIAYVVAARELIDRRLPEPVPGATPSTAPSRSSATTLRAAAPGGRADPLVAVLTDGPANTAWWEHRTIADRLGLALVGVADLDGRRRRALRDASTVARAGSTSSTAARARTACADRTDGPPSRLACSSEPWLRGQVGLVNAFGAGVADDKLAHAYVPDMIRFYLGQEPLLPSVRTYDLAVPEALEDVLSRIDELVIKPREGSGGNGVVIGPHADEADTAATADAVRRRPEGYVAQEIVPLSRHPTLVDGRLEPRHVDLRAFVFLAGERATALPGGLTRVALEGARSSSTRRRTAARRTPGSSAEPHARLAESRRSPSGYGAETHLPTGA